jgi:hypothetical protein
MTEKASEGITLSGNVFGKIGEKLILWAIQIFL